MKEQSKKRKEDEKAAVFLDHVKVLEEAVSQNQFLLMKQAVQQAGILAELEKYRRAVLQKEHKAPRRTVRKGKKEMSGQFALFEEKAS